MTAAKDDFGDDPIAIRVEPPIGWLILNRPERLNAMNRAMWDAIPARIAELEGDERVRVVALRGAGEKAFGAGADIMEFETQRRDPATAAAYAEANDRAFDAIRHCSKPTIAMIRGFCVGGGCAVALCADLRVGATDARIAITPARLGLGYSFRGIEHVVGELGPAAARWLFLTAAQADAERALRLGVLHEVHPPEELDAGVRALAATIAANAPLTLRAAKRCIAEALLPEERRDRAAIEAAVAACFESADYREGLAAFREKRAPKFEGR